MAKDPKTDPATEIQDILTTGKKKPLNFALMKSKEGVVLKAHLTKPPATMVRECKAAGGMPAMQAMGVLNVSGRLVELTLEDPDVSPMLAKLAKTYLASIGLSYKVVFLLPGGIRLGDEDDTAPGDALPETGGDDPNAALRDALLAEFETLAPKLDAARQSGQDPLIKKIDVVETMFRETIATDPNKARGILGLLTKTLEKIAPAASGGGSRSGDLASLEKSVDDLLAEFA
jgi:hypothetical protein